MFDYDVIITFAQLPLFSGFFSPREYCEVGFNTFHDGELYEVLFNVITFSVSFAMHIVLIAASVRNAALAFHL
jgi:hypothetical protein